MILFAAGDKVDLNPRSERCDFVISTAERRLQYAGSTYARLSRAFAADKIVIFEPQSFTDLTALPNIFNLYTLCLQRLKLSEADPHCAIFTDILIDQYLNYDLTDREPKLQLIGHSLTYSLLCLRCREVIRLFELLQRSELKEILEPIFRS